jgi:hypothetical protein
MKKLKSVVIVTTVGNLYSNIVDKKSFCIFWSYYNSFVPNKRKNVVVVCGRVDQEII